MKKKNLRQFRLDGEFINLAEECRKRNLDYPVIHQRIITGQTVEEALSKKIKKHRNFKYNGKTDTLKNLCQKFNWSFSSIRHSMYIKRLSFEEAVQLFLNKSEKPLATLKPMKKNTVKNPKPEKRTTVDISQSEILQLMRRCDERGLNFSC